VTTLIDLDALTDLQVALTPPPPEVVGSDDGHWPGQPPPEVWAEARVDQAVRNRLVEAYHPLVVRVTRRMLASLASHADFDDLCSAGVLGLIDAIGRYDPTRSPFVAFAARRIRGAIGDELRSIDYVTRGQRHRTREAEATAEALAHRLHRTPTPAELAAAGANYRVDPPVRLGSMRKGLDDEDPWGGRPTRDLPPRSWLRRPPSARRCAPPSRPSRHGSDSSLNSGSGEVSPGGRSGPCSGSPSRAFRRSCTRRWIASCSSWGVGSAWISPGRAPPSGDRTAH